MRSPVGMRTQDTDEHFSLGSSHTVEDHDGGGQRVILGTVGIPRMQALIQPKI